MTVESQSRHCLEWKEEIPCFFASHPWYRLSAGPLPMRNRVVVRFVLLWLVLPVASPSDHQPPCKGPVKEKVRLSSNESTPSTSVSCVYSVGKSRPSRKLLHLSGNSFLLYSQELDLVWSPILTTTSLVREHEASVRRNSKHVRTSESGMSENNGVIAGVWRARSRTRLNTIERNVQILYI